MSRYVLQREIPSDVLFPDGAPGNASTDSEWFDCSGFTQVTLFVRYVKVGGHTPTNITFNLAGGFPGSAVEYMIQAGSVSDGLATLSNLQYSKGTGGVTTGFVVDLPVNYPHLIIKSLAVAGGVADDSLSVVAKLGSL